MSAWIVDTHALLWFLDDSERLSRRASETMADPESVLLVSSASMWEIAIKSSHGKLDVPDELPEVLEAQAFGRLNIGREHAWAVRDLPSTGHDDPFDRLLAAQALVEGLPLLSADERFDAYGVQRHW